MLGLALAATLVPAAATSVEPAPIAGAAGAGDRYFPLDGNGGIDVQHYDVRNRYDFDTGLLRGRTVLTLKATQDLRRFNLDLLLRATSVTVDGKPARFTKDGKHELVITPRKILKAGSTVRVVVRHRGRPSRLSYAGERSWAADEREVVAVNQPHIAPYWFAANDHPSDTATFSVAVSVPRGKQVISNGRLVAKKVEGKRVVWRWRARDAMAPYLAFFVAGDFTIRRGRTQGLPWVVAVSEHLPAASRRISMRELKRSASFVRWMEKHLGPYPFETTGGVATSLPLGFALETQTRPVYPGFWRRDTDLVVHELAHQWFGDDLTLTRWRDIWLNEGFATYLEWRRREAVSSTTAAQRLAQELDLRPAGDAFWRVEPGDPGRHALFDESVYVRGAMTLQALRTRIGDDTFGRLLRTWAVSNSGTHVTGPEFEALAAELSGQDLSAFFDAWLRTARRPDTTVENGLVRP